MRMATRSSATSCNTMPRRCFPIPTAAPGDPAKAIAHLTRWTFDLAANTDGFKREQIDDLAGEFPRFDERFAGLDYRHGYLRRQQRPQGADASTCWRISISRPISGRPTNCRRATSCQSRSLCRATPDAPEGDGYLLATIYRGAENAAISPCSMQRRWTRARSPSRNCLIACRSAFTAIGVRRRRAPPARREVPDFFAVRFVANGL